MTLKGHNDYVDALDFSRDGKTLATGSGDKTVRLWDVQSGKELAVLNGHTNPLRYVAFMSENENLASADWNGELRLWKLGSEWESVVFRNHPRLFTPPGTFSPDRTLFTGSLLDGPIRIWDLATERLVQSLIGHASTVCSVAFSPDGKTLASGHDLGTVRLWEIASGKQRTILIGEDRQVPWFFFAGAFLVWVVVWIRVRPKRERP